MQYLIVGVIPDFPVDSIRVAIQPTVYFADQNRLTLISARRSGHAIPEALGQIDAAWPCSSMAHFSPAAVWDTDCEPEQLELQNYSGTRIQIAFVKFSAVAPEKCSCICA